MVPLLTLNPISSGIFQTKGFIIVASSDFTDSVSAYMWVYGALNLSLRYVHLKGSIPPSQYRKLAYIKRKICSYV